MSRPASKRQPVRVFLLYELNIAKKAYKLEEFMAATKENVVNFDAWSFKSLETQVLALRTQVLRMESDWDELRDPTMAAAAFAKISKLVVDSTALGEDTLDRADKFMRFEWTHGTQRWRLDSGSNPSRPSFSNRNTVIQIGDSTAEILK